MVWGANEGHLTMPVFKMIMDIQLSGTVPETVGDMGWPLHIASMTMMTIGALLWGARLMPITSERCLPSLHKGRGSVCAQHWSFDIHAEKQQMSRRGRKAGLHEDFYGARGVTPVSCDATPLPVCQQIS